MIEVDVRKALTGFTLDVRFTAGREIVALFGPSGAGKSLTLASIAGIVRPDGGRIALDGVELYRAGAVDLPPQQRSVGYVPQHAALFPHLIVEANVAYGVRAPAEERAGRVAELLALLGLQGLEKRRPDQLSGGEQQRVALARALAVRPRLLALDEPFAALDVGLRLGLQEELLRVHQAWGGPLLLVTHDRDEAFTLASRVVVLDAGQVLQAGSRDDVFERPRSRRVAELVGVRNLLPARVLATEGGATVLDWEGRRLVVDGGLMAPGAEVTVAVRSGRVLIVRPDRVHPAENAYTGRIVERRPRAENYVLHVRLQESARPWDLETDLPSYVYHRLGLDDCEDVAVTLKRSDLHVIRSDTPSEG